MNDKLDVLSKIKPVEAPPFLLTRITQRIENERISRFSLRISWALGISMFLIFSLNVAILFQNQTKKTSNLAQTMQLLPQNDFYK